MRYCIEVEERMCVFRVVAGVDNPIEPLGPGVYEFERINYPLSCRGDGGSDYDWIVLKKPYEERGEVIGRSVFSTAVHFAEAEGFRIVSEYNTKSLAPCGC